MIEPMIESSVRLLEWVFRDELGTSNFWTLVAVSLFAWTVVVWGLSRALGQGAGLVFSALGVVASLLVALVGYAAVEVSLVPQLEGSWAAYMPWVGLGLGFLLGVWTLGRWCLRRSGFVALLLLAFGALGASMAYYGTVQLLDLVNRAEDGGGQRESSLPGVE